PDVLGTQEGLPDQVGDLARGLPHYAFLGAGRMADGRDERNAIFYRPDRFDVEAHGDFWLSNTPDVPGSLHWGNYVPRMATWARLFDRENDAPLFVINTHLDHFAPRARKRAVQLIHSMLPADGNVLLMGDFNAPPGGYTYRYLTRKSAGPRLLDSMRHAEERAPAHWNATFHKFWGRGLYRIDYIFAREPTRVARHVVVRDEFDGVYPSDHFPVFAELEMEHAAS
ncbi:MAG: endonuclease/exonuclease/phosphatase family protein, partial [Thermoplasmatota archaeon]